MADILVPGDLWADIEAVRAGVPLVHSITNLVVMNFNANVLLAAGAAPVMAHAHEEVDAMAGIAQALVLNIGTLEPYWVESMCSAARVAQRRGIPIVLDPVGAGATPYRNQSIEAVIGAAPPSVIRGNASEIMSTAGLAVRTRGVDSAAAQGDSAGAARALAQRTGGTVCASGEVDLVVDARGRWARLANGHVWMTRITGVGCSASALVGAFCAVQPDSWRATVSAMALIALAGEIAAERAANEGRGVGSMAVHLLDTLQLLDRAAFETRLRLETGE